MKIQTHPLIIPAKAGTQEKVEKKRPISYIMEKIVLFQWIYWIPAFAGMTKWWRGSAFYETGRHLKLGVLILTIGTLFIFTSLNVLAAQSSEEMSLSSSSFQKNASIPTQYTAQGEEVSPPLEWKNVPKRTRSLALVCVDPDAPNGNWVHWILYNIPPTLDHIEKGGGNLPAQVRIGKNSHGNRAYNGPNPPNGTHHYHFKLYALDKVLDLKAGATQDDLQKSMEGHILEETTFVGLYKKK